jgi:hypothetical protein
MSHTTDLPNYFPSEIQIGETLEFELDLPDFPADEWTVTFYVRGAGAGFDVAGTADGTIHQFAVAASVTATLTAGNYYFQALAVKGSEKHLVSEGPTLAKVSLAALTTATTYDPRSQAKKIVDAIDTLLAGGKISNDQKRYKIGGIGADRELERLSMEELLAARKFYGQIVSAENRKKRKTPFKTIGVQFEDPQ